MVVEKLLFPLGKYEDVCVCVFPSTGLDVKTVSCGELLSDYLAIQKKKQKQKIDPSTPSSHPCLSFYRQDKKT